MTRQQRTIETRPVSLESFMGSDAGFARNTLSESVLEPMRYEGAREWNTWEKENPHFRPEWRADGSALVFLFYDTEGPNPQHRYDDPTAFRVNERGHVVPDVVHGKHVYLGGGFERLLLDVCTLVFAPLNVKLSFEELLLAWRLEIPNAATVPLKMRHYVQRLLDILDVNCGRAA